MNKKIGVIIGRFQVAELTSGHCHLIDTVFQRHTSVLILIGVHSSQPTERNPLNFDARKAMIQAKYPMAVILPIKDSISDLHWSSRVDVLIESLLFSHENGAIVYGSRDSFKYRYSGKYDVEIIPEIPDTAGTYARSLISKRLLSSIDFRCGIIYGAFNRFPTAYMAVDIAMIKEGKEVLLARKPDEEHYRFVGGFVDPSDESLARAAKRELMEEVGNIEVADFEIVGETKIDDWRYKHDQESVFTVLFKCKYIFGIVKPQDDIISCAWFNISDLETIQLMPAHEPLKKMLLDNLKK